MGCAYQRRIKKKKVSGRGYATELLKTNEEDAREYFHIDYLCCNSAANDLYEAVERK